MRVKSNQDGVEDGVFYFLTDHLGSTVITLDAEANQIAELRYSAWGETRYSNGDTPTQRRYTGQLETEAGLYFYNARWFDTALGRFAQADSLIPQPGSPLAWDRYAYTQNNPVNFNDPSGHVQGCADGDLGGGCGNDGTSFYILSKYIEKKEQGTIVYWAGLLPEEQNALNNDHWNSDIWKDAIGSPGVTKADVLHDPAVWVSTLPFLLRSPVIYQAALTACITSSVCSNLFLGIQPYGEMPSIRGFERHHLIEKRFAGILGVNPNSIPSVYLSPEEHRIFTTLWQQVIGYRGSLSALNTTTATIDDIWNAAQQIYSQNPVLLKAVRVFLFGQ